MPGRHGDDPHRSCTVRSLYCTDCVYSCERQHQRFDGVFGASARRVTPCQAGRHDSLAWVWPGSRAGRDHRDPVRRAVRHGTWQQGQTSADDGEDLRAIRSHVRHFPGGGVRHARLLNLCNTHLIHLRCLFVSTRILQMGGDV
ncbi:hypothetical protein PBRA_003387 [Plasmodiophora brassicae]|uniref:Uncharacterized protein n=1 Tax=Plasmodiophora brassicae TaxID=37360 RepID=A0A0G4J893_PLABS|nr:hypothetical protein PBRA_003387 [Plasmodiophora brassicae]